MLVRFETGVDQTVINVYEKKDGRKKYIFYARTLNPESNRAVAELLRDKEEENLCRGIKCADGRPRDLWLIDDYDTVDQLNNSRSQFQLRFEVWVKYGEDGLPKLFKPSRKSKINLATAVSKGMPAKSKAKAKPKGKGESRSGRPDHYPFAKAKAKQPLKVR